MLRRQTGQTTAEHRIVFMGPAKAGKTCIIRRFICDDFQNDYSPTVEDAHRQILRSPDGSCEILELLDTSGSFQFPAMRELNVRIGHAFAVVMGLDDRENLTLVRSICQEIKRIKSRDSAQVNLVLVGNKCDLQPPERNVSPELAASLAREFNCRYMETSAKMGDNVSELLELIVYRYLNVDELAHFISSLTKQCAHDSKKRHSADAARHYCLLLPYNAAQVDMTGDKTRKLTRVSWKHRRLSADMCSEYSNLQSRPVKANHTGEERRQRHCQLL